MRMSKEFVAASEMKSYLLGIITENIKRRNITQTEAAKVIGVDQSRLSKMMRGDFLSLSIDKLFGMLVKLGCRVEVRVLDECANGEYDG